jgi:DNA-binding response OmpR family regulator
LGSHTLAGVTFRILLVEDDPGIASGLDRALTAEGYAVRVAATGGEALGWLTADDKPDLVLLDLGLPDMDGVDLCGRIVADHCGLPVVAVTARRDVLDVVVGLDAGAVDYVTKPFRLAELLARVRAQLRTVRDADDATTLGLLRVDRAARRAWLADDELDLRAKEFDLLAFLVARAGVVVSRGDVMAGVWGEDWFGSTKTLDVHMVSLRRKVGADGDGPIRISTIRGIGYRLERP